MIARPLTANDIVAIALRNHPCCDLRSCVCETPCACGSDNECAYDNREHVARRLSTPTPEEWQAWHESPIVKAWLGPNADRPLRAYQGEVYGLTTAPLRAQQGESPIWRDGGKER